jgi:AcrR family transcriptional regulator
MTSRAVNTRAYDNAGRAAQARATRRRVIDAAHSLLLEKGYASTTMGEVAVRAGVSVETVYKRFGSKAALTKQVYDVVLAGDDEPVPLRERPQIQAILAESDPRRKVARYAALARQLGERLGPLLAVLLGSRSADADLDEFARTTDEERLTGSAAFVAQLADSGGLRRGVDPDRARDVLWALISPELYLLLVVRRGWPLDDYERWLVEAISDALLSPGDDPGRSHHRGTRTMQPDQHGKHEQGRKGDEP